MISSQLFLFNALPIWILPALSLLQEEADAARRKDFKHTDFTLKPKLVLSSSPLPLPLPPPRPDKSLGGVQWGCVLLMLVQPLKQRARCLLFVLTGGHTM
jgi:hypothetical protein